jgi:DNA/RNA-binding domain of Phe-tRNA-synthetase-like protein
MAFPRKRSQIRDEQRTMVARSIREMMGVVFGPPGRFAEVIS